MSFDSQLIILCIVLYHTGGINGSLRLAGGNNIFEGRVEICTGGEWRPISTVGWDDQDAAVVCRQLGLSDQGTYVVQLITVKTFND